MNPSGSVSMILRIPPHVKNLSEFVWMEMWIWTSRTEVMKMRMLITIEEEKRWWRLTNPFPRIPTLVCFKSRRKIGFIRVRKLKKLTWTVLKKEEGRDSMLSTRLNQRWRWCPRKRKRSFLMIIPELWSFQLDSLIWNTFQICFRKTQRYFYLNSGQKISSDKSKRDSDG